MTLPSLPNLGLLTPLPSPARGREARGEGDTLPPLRPPAQPKFAKPPPPLYPGLLLKTKKPDLLVRLKDTQLVRHLKELALLVFIAAFYFGSVYFAVAALFPTLALQAAFLAAMGAVVIYLILILIERDRSIFFGLLVLLPVTCLTAGVAWWLLRLLGLWTVD
jgi:hypothetical protein